MRFIGLPILLLLIIVSKSANSQDSIPKISSQYFDAISKKANSLNQKLDKKSEKVLANMQKQEAKLHKKLAKIDSIAATNLFKDANDKYKQIQSKLKSTQSLLHYIPNLDTLSTSLKFLAQNQQWISHVKDANERLSNANNKLKELQSKLQSAEDIKQFLKERRQYLKQQLEKFGLAKDLKKLNKEVYYYSQQINEYREILKDSKKAERKAFELLSKTKLFKDFIKKNSMLASLFRFPSDPNDPNFASNLAGLQTRSQVNSIIQNQIAAGGPNAQQAFQQNLQQAQSQIQRLKDKINKLGGGSSDTEIPDFKPNNEKTKTFLQRLEVGTNFQSQGAEWVLPATTDVGISIGYKLNDKSTIGIGASYKLGWGRGWNQIKISHQGASVRSFLDWKIKGSFYLSGGYEMNYRPDLNGFSIPTRSGTFYAGKWQQSGLMGLSKILSIRSKFFKKTKAQILWDYLSYKQIPKAQPVLFRVGYNF